MQSPFLTSLILSVILTPAFNCISFLINPRWQKNMTLLASLLATASSMALFGFLLNDPELAEKSFLLFEWISIPGESSLNLGLEFQVTLLASLFLIVSNALYSLLILFQLKSAEDPDQPNPILFFSSLAVGFSNLFLISDNLIFCFIFLELVSLMVFLAGSLSGKSSVNSMQNRRLFLHIHFFNMLLLVAFCFIRFHFETFRISEILSMEDRIALLQSKSEAVLFMIAFLLIASVAGRCGQFPFPGWTEHVSRQSGWTVSLIQTVTLVPLSFYLLFRISPILTTSPEACLLMSLAGGLTILMVSLISLFQENTSVSLGYLVAANWGIIFSSLSLPEKMWPNLILYFLSSLCLIALLIDMESLVKESAEENPEQVITLKPILNPKLAKAGLLIAILYLFTGFSTLSMLIEPYGQALFNSGSAFSGESLSLNFYGLTPKQILGAHYVILLLGNFCLSMAAFRYYFRISGEMKTDQVTTSLPARPGFFSLGIFLVLPVGIWTLGLLLKTPLMDSFREQSLERVIPFQAGLIQLVSAMGIATAWILFSRESSDSGTVSIQQGAFSRLCRNRFYLEDLIFLGFLLPVRGIGQLCRFFDWLVIDGLLVNLPSKVMKKIAWFYEPMESSEMPFPLISTLSAIVVMLITLGWVWVSYY